MEPAATAAAELTVRLTYVGQKANQGLLLPLTAQSAHAAASTEDTSRPVECVDADDVPKTAILDVLIDSAVDMHRWQPLWYDVRSKGWRDLEATTTPIPRPATDLGRPTTLDIRLVDRAAPGGCTPEGQLPLGVGIAASDLGELARRGGDAGGRGGTTGGAAPCNAIPEHEAPGYFGIGVVGLKTQANLGTLWRSAWQLGAAYIFTVGARFEKQSSDTYQTWTRIPCFEHSDWAAFARASPYSAPWVAVEMGEHSVPLEEFEHPDRAVYILGSEDTGLPESIVRACALHVSLPSVRSPSYNVAVAGSIIMYDRHAKAAQHNK